MGDAHILATNASPGSGPATPTSSRSSTPAESMTIGSRPAIRNALSSHALRFSASATQWRHRSGPAMLQHLLLCQHQVAAGSISLSRVILLATTLVATGSPSIARPMIRLTRNSHALVFSSASSVPSSARTPTAPAMNMDLRGGRANLINFDKLRYRLMPTSTPSLAVTTVEYTIQRPLVWMAWRSEHLEHRR